MIQKIAKKCNYNVITCYYNVITRKCYYNVITKKCNYNVITQKCYYNVITSLFWGCVITMLLHAYPAAAVTIFEPIETGGLVYGQLEAGEKLSVQGTQIIPDKDGRFVFGLSQDSPDTLTLSTSKEKITRPVHQRTWDEEKIFGLPPQTTAPNPANQKRIATENKMIQDNRQFYTTDFFPACFIRPVQENYRISGNFGARRIYNNVLRGRHSGVDYAAPTGTPILSPADGIVRLVHEDMFLTGKTVLIDHGYGVYTSYSHLSHIEVEQNQHIKAGEHIGQIGATGRSTGPHLHFTLTWFGVRVDPEKNIQDHLCR